MPLRSVSEVRITSGNGVDHGPVLRHPRLPLVFEKEPVDEEIRLLVLPAAQRHQLFEGDHALVASDVGKDVLPLGFLPSCIRIALEELMALSGREQEEANLLINRLLLEYEGAGQRRTGP